jgi:hypothetical protein
MSICSHAEISQCQGPKELYLPPDLMPEYISYSKDTMIMQPGRLNLAELIPIIEVEKSVLSNDIKRIHETHGMDLRFLFDESSFSPPGWGTRLPVTELRKTLFLAFVFFTNKIECELERTPEWRDVIRYNDNEYNLLRGNLPGMQIVGPQNADMKCMTYVFKDEPWFDPTHPEKSLPLEIDSCLDVLKSKYTQVTTPEIGDFVVYGTDAYARHFGLIVEKNSDGRPIVESKFGIGFVYRHPLDGVSPFYGDQVAFFRGLGKTLEPAQKRLKLIEENLSLISQAKFEENHVYL